MVLLGVRSVIKTQDFEFCKNFWVLRIFDEVLIDLHRKVAQNPWDFGFGPPEGSPNLYPALHERAYSATRKRAYSATLAE